MTAGELMCPSSVTIAQTESVLTAARLMSRHNIGSVPVVTSQGKLLGMITDRDLVLRCVAAGSDPASTPVSELMTRRLATVSEQTDIRDAARLMASRQVRRLPVTGGGGQLLGMLALGDIARQKGYDMECSQALGEISDNLRRL